MSVETIRKYLRLFLCAVPPLAAAGACRSPVSPTEPVAQADLAATADDQATRPAGVPTALTTDEPRAPGVATRGDNRGQRIVGQPWATRSPVLGGRGMAASSHPLATAIAVDTLKRGGTAVDAAIAANAATGLMEPTGCGIGGDLFAIVWDPSSKSLYGLNASGRSPAGQTLAELRQRVQALQGHIREMPNWGSLSVTVPGAVDGWFELHERFGKLSMAKILKPAIDYAESGFPVTQLIGHYLQKSHQRFLELHAAGQIEEIDNYLATYTQAGQPLAEGQILKNPGLAASYRALARGGRDAFYRGSLTKVMIAYLKRIGAPLTAVDFAEHQSEWVEPVSIDYRGYRVHELPPNGQGIAALQMLQILKGYDLRAMGHNSADYLHVMAEAKKLAFEDRARFYADMQHYATPVGRLLSDAYADERRGKIDMQRAAQYVEHGDPKLLQGDTIYLTVADESGMMVSLIQSNYRGMGSGLVPDGLGFMFQDRGALFSLADGHPNVYAPKKRPFHTIIPAFVTKNGEAWLSFGLMGGAMQPQGHAQIIVNMVDFGMNPQEAGDAARFHHKGSTEPTWVSRMRDGGVLELESGVRAEVIEELKRRGHVVSVTSGPFGGYQAILRAADTGVYWGASEMRKDGLALGY